MGYKDKVRQAEYNRNWNKNNRPKKSAADKRWVQKNQQQVLEYQRTWHKQNPEYRKQEYRRNIETYKKYKRENPQSGHLGYPELYEAMMNVRFRDNNTCQWQGCGKKHWRGKVTVHVHHIFPRSEYPDYELVEKYMICYCKEHHIEWHEKRGDLNAVNILKSHGTGISGY
jgi:hypothetical protein